MRKGIFALAVLVVAPAFGQTTTTNCQQWLNQINCTSQTRPQVNPADAASFTNNFNSAALLRDIQAAQQQMLLQQQAENARLQNELLRQQLAAQRDTADQRASRVREESLAIQRVFFRIYDKNISLPQAERLSQQEFNDELLLGIRSEIGRPPLDASIDMATAEVERILDLRAQIAASQRQPQ